MATSILTPENFLYVADFGTARLKINPTDSDVEVFERIIPFNATSSSLPLFNRIPGVFPPNKIGEHNLPQYSIPTGSLYQALAFPRGTISAGSSPKEDDFPQAVGRVELPSI